MNSKYYKILRAFLVDPQLQVRGLVLLTLVVIFLFQAKAIGNQSKAIRQVNDQKALVAKIPAMEKTIQANTIVTGHLNTVTKVAFNLEGTTIREGVPYALIDGVVYAEGDTIGNYKIETIILEQGGQVTLRDEKTQEIKVLYVPPPK
jgi:hypothetical protein